MILDIIAIALLVFGFGFVVFFHELGHFLAAKWVGIKVEQFAVGFGHAVWAWRRGIGWRWGTTTPEYERRIKEHIEKAQSDSLQSREGGLPSVAQVSKAAAELNLGDTEYRLNWIPLGGYVKMLGQDDLNPNAHSDDPGSYNRKSVGARMFVVSAGVLMNVLLAAILFMIVFLIGFKVPPPIIGSIETGSPAQEAGLRVGDRVLYLNGEYQHDFTKLYLNTALLPAGEDVAVVVQRPGQDEPLTLKVRPRHATNSAGSFLSLGIGHGAMSELRGLDPKVKVDAPLDPNTEVLPGDVITAINGVAVNDPKRDYPLLMQAIEQSQGKPVPLTVRGVDGRDRAVRAQVHFQSFFGEDPVNFAGLLPRAAVGPVLPDSPVSGKLREGDIVVEVRSNGESLMHPSVDQFVEKVQKAGKEGRKIGFVVDRDGALVNVEELVPTVRTQKGKRGVGIGLALDERHPVVADVAEGSAAAKAGVPRRALIVKVNGQDVTSWFDVHRLLRGSGTVAPEAATLSYVLTDERGQPLDQQPTHVTLKLSAEEQQRLAQVRYTHNLLLKERIDERQTSNPLTAAAWGVTETRDLLLQFYVTLRRLFQGSVGASNLMGPIGIVHAGSLFAFKGPDWLIWFLAMISANLAVVNFLPIPIVDGGLFAFLIIEKISGRPISPKMQTAAQIVGLAIILSVFLLVTYQDIARLIL